MRATHIPRLPKKKPLRGKKVGSAEKKTAPDAKKWRIVCIKGGIFLPMILATTDPLEALHSGYAISKLRSPAPRLHRVVHDMPSPMAGLVAIGGISISFFVGRDVFMLEMGQKNKKRRNL